MVLLAIGVVSGLLVGIVLTLPFEEWASEAVYDVTFPQ